MGIIRGKLYDRPTPLTDKIIVGESSFYQDKDCVWRDKKSDEICEVISLEELFEENNEEKK